MLSVSLVRDSERRQKIAGVSALRMNLATLLRKLRLQSHSALGTKTHLSQRLGHD